MEKAEVYFADMRAYPGKENLLQKLNRLMVKAGIDKIDFKINLSQLKFTSVNQAIWHIFARILLKS